MEPKFSVIIPSFNRASTLVRAINSVISQSIPAWEIIVVDDGSSDDTSKVINTFPQVIYQYQENSGVSAARNKGAKLASGNWLIFLDSDDELLPEAIREFASAILNNNSAQLIKARHELIPIDSTKKKIKFGSGYIPGSFCIDREQFMKIGGYDFQLKFAENTELIFRLERVEVTIKRIDKVVLRYFENASGGSKNLQNMLDSIRLILAKHDDYLTNHVKHLYHQNIGVIEMRNGRFELARKHLWKSWKFKPQKLSTLMRISLAYFPALARKIYTPEIDLR